MFVAKVKNGFLPRTQRDILSALRKLETDQCPFANLPKTERPDGDSRLLRRR